MRDPWLAILLATGLAIATPGAAIAAAERPLDIREGSLATALADLARQARLDLLYDRKLVSGRSAKPIRGRFPAEAALAKLLAGSGVGYRAMPGGAFVLFALPAARPTVASGDGAISELLVVGRRTQNVDIRRTENDIQPYRIFDRHEIESSGRTSVDDFLRSRETANARQGRLSLSGGEPRTVVDLRGFGEQSTLVLVDGRRLPQAPSLGGAFNQADLSGVPLGAIERIEVLTTTAGGIYGVGAIGGVVNLVLRRDYRGADVIVEGGITDRGDGEEGRVEGRIGFTPDHGATDVMITLADRREAPLRRGERDYLERAGRRWFGNDPGSDFPQSLPIRNGVSVASLFGESLTLDPAYGGAALGSRYTFLPTGFSGTPAEAGAQLLANAGRLPFDLSSDLSGKRQYIETRPHVTSGLLNVRRQFGANIEVFVDGAYARTRGRFLGASDSERYFLSGANAGNPFGQAIAVSFPQAVLSLDTRYRFDASRATAGAIVQLPRGWRASLDYTLAETTLRARSLTVDTSLSSGFTRGTVLPFGDWNALQGILPSFIFKSDDRARIKNHLHDGSLRLAGPLLTLPGGPLTVTLLGEDREDRIGDTTFDLFGLPLTTPARSLAVRSAYAEVRAPITRPDDERPWLRGLELQLAVRHDRLVQKGSSQIVALDPGNLFSLHSHSTTYTAGGQLAPVRALMLRGSVATGERPPTLTDLQTAPFGFGGDAPDPRRGGRLIGTEAPLAFLLGGSLRVRSAHARSVTVGAVLNPEGGPRPRLSIDYSRIVLSREPATFPLDPVALLAAEAQYPDRVIREPVTDADRAAGFTVGPVTALDFTSGNLGRTVVEAVDAQLDWRLPDMGVGDVRLYGALTWQPTFRQRRPLAGVVDQANAFYGPLEWRGNGGVEWVRGPISVELNAQYYGRYRVTPTGQTADYEASVVRAQGSADVPAQVYVDLTVRRRFTLSSASGPFAGLETRLSVLNLFDHSPPIVAADTLLGFSPYGDPRRRRVLLTLSGQF